MFGSKVWLVVLVLALLALMSIGIVAGSTPCYSCALGDANEDGVINVLDITTAERMAAGLIPPTFAADVNHDAIIDALDIALITQLVVTQKVQIIGDANQDGIINVLDITTTERMVAGIIPPSVTADVNCDGVVNTLDITAVERLVATVS